MFKIKYIFQKKKVHNETTEIQANALMIFKLCTINYYCYFQKEKVYNEIAEIQANATAQANLIRARADANATAIIEQSRSDGLNYLYDKLGISAEQYKLSFDYVSSLKDMNELHLSINFNQLIVAPRP